MKHVFISYARAQIHFSEKVESILQENGFATWRDVRDLDPYQDFTGEIEQAIRNSSHMIVCLTEDVN